MALQCIGVEECQLRQNRSSGVCVLVEQNRLVFDENWTIELQDKPETLDQFIELIHPHEQQTFKSRYTAIWEDGSPQQCDFRICDSEGAYFCLLANFDLVRQEDAERVCITCVDITNRKKAEWEYYQNPYMQTSKFNETWENDPKGLCHFVGRALADVPPACYNDFFLVFGACLFARHQVPKRIEFLLDLEQPKESKLLGSWAEIEVQDGIVCLKDRSGKHYGIRLMLLKHMVNDALTYSVRYFVKGKEHVKGYLKRCWRRRNRPVFEEVLQAVFGEDGRRIPLQYETDYHFWNFKAEVNPGEGVIVYPRAEGFYDWQETHNLLLFLRGVTNRLGFKEVLQEKGVD